jgi:putative ABC transport system permease protein
MYWLEIKSMFKEKGIMALGVGGVTVSILLVIALKGVLLGTVSVAGEYPRNAGADIFVTQSGIANMIAGSSTLPVTIPEELREIEGVQDVYPIYGTLYSFDIKSKKIAAFLIGYNLEKDIGKPWLISSGRTIEKSGEIVIDSALSKSSNVNLGDHVFLSGRDFEIVGFSEGTNSLGSQYIFISDDDARTLLNGEHYINYALVTVNMETESVTAAIESQFSEVNAYAKDDFAKNNEQCLYEIMQTPMDMMIYIGIFIAIIVSGMCIYTVTNMKLTDYLTLKALGVSGTKIGKAVIAQTMIINFLSFIFAGILAYGLKVLFDHMGLTVSLLLTYDIYLYAGVVCVLASIIVLFFPLRRVSKIDPVEVFSV